jgi:hypothetical protein
MLLSILCAAPVTFIFAFAVYAPPCEWALHRDAMHKEVPGFGFAYRGHKLHHSVFGAGTTFHLQPGVDWRIITMAFWQGVALTAVGTMPVAVPSYFFTPEGWLALAIVVNLAWAAGVFVYYGGYEFFHLCMHWPKNRRLEKIKLYRRLKGHHLNHHRNMRTNFNVVLPWCDWLFGTMNMRRRGFFAGVHA